MKTTNYKELKKQVEEQYQKAIAQAQKERMDNLAAIDAVWKMLHPSKAKLKSETTTNSGNTTKELPSIVYGTLMETIKKSLSLVTQDKFTCKDVIAAMEKISSGKFNYSSVSNALKRLAKEGVIEITKQGKGKSPSEYRYKPPVVVTGEKDTGET